MSTGGGSNAPIEGGSDFSDLACSTTGPLLDNPVGVLFDPLGHLELTVHHAALRSEVCGLKIQMYVFAARRLVDHTDSNNKLNHRTPPGVEGSGHSVEWSVEPGACPHCSLFMISDYDSKSMHKILSAQ